MSPIYHRIRKRVLLTRKCGSGKQRTQVMEVGQDVNFPSKDGISLSIYTKLQYDH